MYEPLSQRDPRWADVKLGFSSTETLGTAGCLTTCFAMLAGVSPIEMNDCRKTTGGYQPKSGLAANFDISKCAPGVKMMHASQRYTGLVPASALAMLLGHLNAGQPAIIEVDSSPASGLQQHFVLAVPRSDIFISARGDGDDEAAAAAVLGTVKSINELDVADLMGVDPVTPIEINDPWTGARRPLAPTYGATIGKAVWRFILYETETVSGPSSPAPGTYECTENLNFRAATPDIGTGTLGQLIGTWRAGTRLGVVAVTKVGAGYWGRVPIDEINDVALVRPGAGYVNLQYARRVDPVPPPPPPPPPPPTTTSPYITINVLGGGGPVRDALGLGAQAIQSTFNPGHGIEVAQMGMGTWIIARPAMWGSAPDVGLWRQRIEFDRWAALPAAVKARCILCGANENDVGVPPDTPQGVLDRKHFDLSLFTLCRDAGLRYAGGGYAVASADMTNPNIVAAFREHYAPLFNQGMYWNLHCYMARDGSVDDVPCMERWTRTYPLTMHGQTITIRQSYWTAEWWRWFFLFCGFDPRASWVIQDEMGIEGDIRMPPAINPGGFPANPGLDMIAYLRTAQRYAGEPVAYGGADGRKPIQWLKSPVKIMSVFCAGSDAPGSKWYGYDVTPRIPDIAQALWVGARVPD